MEEYMYSIILYSLAILAAILIFYFEGYLPAKRKWLKNAIPTLTEAQSFDHTLVTERLIILRDLIIDIEDELDLIEENKEADPIEKVKRLSARLDAYRNSYANLMVVNNTYLNRL